METPLSRAQLLRETRKMRFEKAYGGWQAKRLAQEEAALMLGVSDRSFRRFVVRYEAEELAGLLDRRIEQVSKRCAPVDEVMRLVVSSVLILPSIISHEETVSMVCVRTGEPLPSAYCRRSRDAGESWELSHEPSGPRVRADLHGRIRYGP